MLPHNKLYQPTIMRFWHAMGGSRLSAICFSENYFIHHRVEQAAEGKFKWETRKKVHIDHISITKLSQFPPPFLKSHHHILITKVRLFEVNVRPKEFFLKGGDTFPSHNYNFLTVMVWPFPFQELYLFIFFQFVTFPSHFYNKSLKM